MPKVALCIARLHTLVFNVALWIRISKPFTVCLMATSLPTPSNALATIKSGILAKPYDEIAAAAAATAIAAVEDKVLSETRMASDLEEVHADLAPACAAMKPLRRSSDAEAIKTRAEEDQESTAAEKSAGERHTAEALASPPTPAPRPRCPNQSGNGW